MAGSPVKLGIIIAALVVGIVTLSTAFETSSPVVGPGPVGPSAAVSPSEGHARPARISVSPGSGEGAHVAVYNGTDQTGLASAVGNKLQKKGYVVDEVGDTVSPAATTAVYFVRSNDQAAATFLAQALFKNAPVSAVPGGFKVSTGSPKKSAQLIVVVGADYNG